MFRGEEVRKGRFTREGGKQLYRTGGASLYGRGKSPDSKKKKVEANCVRTFVGELPWKILEGARQFFVPKSSLES